MATPAVTVRPDTSLAQAARLMAERTSNDSWSSTRPAPSRASSAVPICSRCSYARTVNSRTR
ncbi:hypothetical protein [Streptomyces sp. NPDC058412]|uniref:hypothetical protein n=1 Tax=Streptomyces sp. NPDC058412 TaxID=3346486 RepID=UPI00364D8885